MDALLALANRDQRKLEREHDRKKKESQLDLDLKRKAFDAKESQLGPHNPSGMKLKM